MTESNVGAVLAEFRSILGEIDGLSPGRYPSEQDHNRIVCMVYPGPGRAQIGTSSGGHSGLPQRWQFDTIIIDVVTPRSDMAYDFAAVETYAESVTATLFKSFYTHRFAGLTVTLGDATTPGSTWPVRRSLIFPQQAGVDVIGYRWEVDVSYQVDIT
jgi:hypothetical protein